MVAQNKRSRIRMARVPIPYDDYLIEKANENPENKHNHVATEINALIKADFDKAQRREKRR